jgi:transcriptional regulator with XRE-family HTH domain
LSESGSPPATVRRSELGVRLRELRAARSWTAQYVAAQLGWSSSKLSRAEHGERGVKEEDIEKLCDLYQVPAAQRRELTELAAGGKRRRLLSGLFYSTYADMEAGASTIRDFGLTAIPGQLQTADYAEAVLRAIKGDEDEAVIASLLAGRLERQRVLESPTPPQFDAVIDESALYRAVGRPEIMRGQLLHLVEMSRRLNVSLQVLPYSTGLPAANNKFILLTFAPAKVPDVVYIESLSDDRYLDKPEDVAAYRDAFAAMQRTALSREESRAMISARVDALAGR